MGESVNKLSKFFLALLISLMVSGVAHAQTFKVIGGKSKEGEILIEARNSVFSDDVNDGEQRSAHSIELGYGISDRAHVIVALDFTNERRGDVNVESYEVKGTYAFLLNQLEEGESGLTALSVFTKLDIPDEGGFDESDLTVGPVVHYQAGPVGFIGNLFMVVPFEGGEHEALVYKAGVKTELIGDFEIGAEFHGRVNNVFEGDSSHALYLGPTLSGDFRPDPRGPVFGARLATLFGVDDTRTDLAVSLNVEMRF